MDDIIKSAQDSARGRFIRGVTLDTIIYDLAHSVAEVVRAEAYQRGFDAGMEVAEEQHTGRVLSPTQEK